MADITGFGSFSAVLDEFGQELESAADYEIDAAIDEATKQTALEVERVAKREVPVESGELRASIGTTRLSNAHYSVGTNKEYAPHIEYGTVPHSITPNGNYPLVFEVNGEWVATYHVDHPGHRAYPYIRPAIAENRGELVERIGDEIEELLEDL